MTCIVDTKSKRHLPAKLAVGLAISAFLVLGTFVTSASAQERRGGDRGGDRGYGGWSGGYYAAPPVVYGSPYYYPPAPYYYPPPVVYGPSVGIALPGINIGIH